SGGRSKKLAEATPAAAVVPPGRAECRVRRPDGGRTRCVPPAPRRGPPADLHRRAAEAAGERGPGATPASGRHPGPVRLRVQAGGRRLPVYAVPAAARVAARMADRAADGEGLRRGPAVAG